MKPHGPLEASRGSRHHLAPLPLYALLHDFCCLGYIWHEYTCSYLPTTTTTIKTAANTEKLDFLRNPELLHSYGQYQLCEPTQYCTQTLGWFVFSVTRETLQGLAYRRNKLRLPAQAWLIVSLTAARSGLSP